MSTGPMTLPANGPRSTPGSSAAGCPDSRTRGSGRSSACILLVPVVGGARAGHGPAGRRRPPGLRRDAHPVADRALHRRLGADAGPAQGADGRRRAPGRRRRRNADAYNLRVAEHRRADDRVQARRAQRCPAVPESVQARLAAIDDHLATLDDTRQEVLDREQMSVAEAVLRYGVVLTDLVAYGETPRSVLRRGRARGQPAARSAAFARAKAAHRRAGGGRLRRAVARRGLERGAVLRVRRHPDQPAGGARRLRPGSPPPASGDWSTATVTGDAVTLADQVVHRARPASVGEAAAVRHDTSAVAIGAVIDLMRWAETRLERELLGQADAARRRRRSGRRPSRRSLVLIVLIVAHRARRRAGPLAQPLAAPAARGRARGGQPRPARRGRPAARRRQLGDGGVEEIVRQVRDPIRLSNRDEVGAGGRWPSTSVHREAVRVAAEQAALRTSVSAMFLNLARRSQTLVDRMIGELDTIERGEEDPKRLAQLFELDHLATRMRRNDENLLVLAGADSSRAAPRGRPAGRRAAGRPVRGRALQPDRVRHRRHRHLGGRARGQRRGPAARRAARQRDPVLAAEHRGGRRRPADPRLRA